MHEDYLVISTHRKVPGRIAAESREGLWEKLAWKTGEVGLDVSDANLVSLAAQAWGVGKRDVLLITPDSDSDLRNLVQIADEYRAMEKELLNLGNERRELIAEMAGKKMPHAHIAAITGMSRTTILRDLERLASK